MKSVNLEKTLEYLKIQENLRSENFGEYYLSIQEYFDILLGTPKTCFTSTK